ncbi:MAG: AAA family ATPase [Candidatus Gracilibacteria bacterium]|nr:AAA family ATPase [Candidatus Gracilibacteria bacterium]
MSFAFSPEAQRVIERIKNPDKHFFITGKAGTGKSTLLEHIRKNANKKMVVLAPTGVAAINVHGETIHSFFKLKPGFELEEAKNMRLDEKKRKKYHSLKTILIDEISMVRADILDAVDVFLRRARQSDEPFGGVQMIFFGDLFQLPPVVRATDRAKFYSEYASPYFFSANVFQVRNLLTEPFQIERIELNEMYRQTDAQFIEVLNAVRENTMTEEHLDILNARVDENFIPPEDESFIHLVTTNAMAHQINIKKLEQIPKPEIEFEATTTGKIAQNLHPNDPKITVKVGAQVMFLQNDAQRRWVNGTIGVVQGCVNRQNKDTDKMETVLLVQIHDGDLVEVTEHTWEISKYEFNGGVFERKQIGSFRQMPLKLAWAVTIHKSQGKSFDRVVIDLGWGSFAHGQTYVALSRCTSLEGVVLKKTLKPSDVIVDACVWQFANGEI